MAVNSTLILEGEIDSVIVTLRGQKAILDRDLAVLYRVTTAALNRATKRNVERFPSDFMFQINKAEQNALADGDARLNRMRFSRTRPYAFTEHGAIMAASVLNSPRAVEASIFVVRAFVKLRQLITTHKELAQKLVLLERKLGDHDEAIVAIMDAIKQLMQPVPGPPKPKIGFRGWNPKRPGPRSEASLTAATVRQRTNAAGHVKLQFTSSLPTITLVQSRILATIAALD